MITAEELRNILDYDPESGFFRWKIIEHKSNRKVGQIAGCLDPTYGYVLLGIKRIQYRAHRLAWLYVYGSWPTEIDHKNRIRSDNRIDNLREATRTNQRMNCAKKKTNAAGFKGVRPHRKKWQALIKYDGKQKVLGTFNSPEEAHSAYMSEASKHFGEFSCPGY